jgi:hypothetical protein
MKSYSLALSLLISLLLMPPAVRAQEFDMGNYDFHQQGAPTTPTSQSDPYGYNQGDSQGEAANSKAATGTQAYTTAPSAWSDMSYIQGQQQATQVPGSLQAPLESTPFGTASTYLGNTGQFLKGASSALGASLPIVELGLNAVNGGYVRNACGKWGSGGFSGSGGGSSVYGMLPPTSTSTVNLNTTINNGY